MKNIILLISIIFLSKIELHASECYRYHTLKYYELFVENNQITFQYTVKDPNGISYVSQEKVILKNIHGKGFKIRSENQDTILFSTIDGYFVAHKNIIQIKDYGVRKIGNMTEINESIGVHFFCINNQWKYIVAGEYTHKNIVKDIAKMPDDLQVITDFPARKILLKNSKNVFYFDTEKKVFKTINGLIGKNTHFFRIKNKYTISDAFLYDEDTFYRISVHDIENLTLAFKSQQTNSSFKNVKISQIEDNISIDTGDGRLWLYKKNGLLHKEEGFSSIPVCFVLKKATYLNSHQEFIRYDNEIYTDFYDLVKGYKSIDFSLVKDKENFHKESAFFYTDGIHKYRYDYEAKTIKPISWMKGKDQLYPKIDTYNFLGNNEMYASSNTIYILSVDPKSKALTISYTSEIKNLTLAIAYDDKLCIENKIISNIADRKTMSFIGSIVDVISPCDGGRGQYPVEIDVYYFFKDQKGIYVYNTNAPKMRSIDGFNEIDNKEGTYILLSKLMTKVKKDQI